MNTPYSCRKSTYSLVGGIAIGLAFSLALGTLLMTSSVMALENSPAVIATKVHVESPTRTLSAKEQNAISLAASRILKHIDQARQAIRNKDDKGAQDNVAQAQKLVQIIDRTQPVAAVDTQISSGNLVYSDKDQVEPTWVTLSDEVDMVDVITPVVSAKAEGRGMASRAASSEVAAGKGDKGRAIAPEVTFAGIEYSTLKLNMNLARTEIENAERALDAGNLRRADMALAQVQSNGVLFSTTSTDLPLHRAYENLNQARWEYKRGDDAATRALLQEAQGALEEHEALLGNEDSKPVKEIQQQIASLSSKLDSTGRKEARALLKKWVDEIEDLVHG